MLSTRTPAHTDLRAAKRLTGSWCALALMGQDYLLGASSVSKIGASVFTTINPNPEAGT